MTRQRQFDVFMHRNTFYHRPLKRCKAGCALFYQRLVFAYCLDRPHFASRNSMQRADNVSRTGLPYVIYGHGVVGSEPSPGFTHFYFSNLNTLHLFVCGYLQAEQTQPAKKSPSKLLRLFLELRCHHE